MAAAISASTTPLPLPSCTDQYKKSVNELVNRLAQSTLLDQLAYLRGDSDWNRLERDISEQHVPTIRFLAAVFSSNNNREPMKTFSSRKILFPFFIRRIGAELSQEDQNTPLIQYLAAFAQEVRKSPTEMEPFFRERNWQGLIRYLAK